MLKKDLIDMVSKKQRVSKKVSKEVVDAIFSCLKEALIRKERVVLTGFGTFLSYKRNSYIAHDPNNPTIKIQVPEYYLPVFRASKTLKKAIDEYKEINE